MCNQGQHRDPPCGTLHVLDDLKKKTVHTNNKRTDLSCYYYYGKDKFTEYKLILFNQYLETKVLLTLFT